MSVQQITTPSVLATIARRAEEGIEDSLLRLGQAWQATRAWNQESASAFAQLCSPRVIAFLRYQFGPMIECNPGLEKMLRETTAVRAELTAQNLRRWDRAAELER